MLTQKTDHDRVQKISVDRVLDKPVSHTPHAFYGNQRLESTLGFRKTDSDEALPPDFSDTEAIKAKLMEEFSEVFYRMNLSDPWQGLPCTLIWSMVLYHAATSRLARFLSNGVSPSTSSLRRWKKRTLLRRSPLASQLHGATQWLSVPKKNSDEPRITVDLTGLNKFVKRPVHPTRVPREAVAAIPPGHEGFTTLDSRHGYWQIPLDELSSKLTTFLTPWGAYRFLRNAMGLSSAGDEHNRRGDEALSGMSNFQKVVEDVIIYNRDIKSQRQQCA